MQLKSILSCAGLAFCISAISSCSKEEASPGLLNQVEEAGGILRSGSGGNMFVVLNGSSSQQKMRVWNECQMCYAVVGPGEVIGGDPEPCPNNTTFNAIIKPQTATTYECIGYTRLPSFQANVIFNKGPNLITGGPQYYIQPLAGNNRPLALQVKGIANIPLPPSGYCSWFYYDALSNTWTTAPGANSYFIWSNFPNNHLPTNCAICPLNW